MVAEQENQRWSLSTGSFNNKRKMIEVFEEVIDEETGKVVLDEEGNPVKRRKVIEDPSGLREENSQDGIYDEFRGKKTKRVGSS